MTRNNWIALAVLTSAVAIGACSRRAGQASDEYNTARDQSGRPVAGTVPVGTRIDLAINGELSSRTNKPGDSFTANVVTDIRDPSGNVLFDAGSTVYGTVMAVQPAPNHRTPGTLTLAVSTIETRGKTFPIKATIDSVSGDAVKVGGGAAAGAGFGQILSKNTKGAAETKDMDIVLPGGSHFIITVTEPVTVATVGTY